MKRFSVLLFGVAAYGIFLGVYLYAIGFVGNFWTPTRLDDPAVVPVGLAVVIDVALLGLFALQHSVMARPWFKRWWSRYVPEPMERSVYVLASSLALMVLFAGWQPIGGVVWDIQNTLGRAVAYTLFATGWLIVLWTTFLINHFDLFGLRQVWLHFRGDPYTPLGFVAPGPYKLVRHPMYIGWLMAFWATPTMTVTHLVFALAITSYILVAIYFEERDLVQSLGHRYATYREQVPMLVPRLRNDSTAESSEATGRAPGS